MKKQAASLLTAVMMVCSMALSAFAIQAEDKTLTVTGTGGAMTVDYNNALMLPSATFPNPTATQAVSIQYTAGTISKVTMTPGDSKEQILYGVEHSLSDMPARQVDVEWTVFKGTTEYTLDITYKEAAGSVDNHALITFDFPGLVMNTGNGNGSTPGGNEPGGNTPGGNEPGGNTPGGNEPGNSGANSKAPVISSSKTTSTLVPVTLTASVTESDYDDVSKVQIKTPEKTHPAGTTQVTYSAKSNGTYTFTTIYDGVEKGSSSFTVNNIISTKPSVGYINYSNVNANTMKVSVPLNDWDMNLYQIDMSGIESVYSPDFNNGVFTANLPNTTKSYSLKYYAREDSSITGTINFTAVKQSYSSSGSSGGSLDFDKYTVLSFDDDGKEMSLRLHFDNMEDYTYDTSSLSSKYHATVSGSNTIDVDVDNKAQTLKLEFKDANGKTVKESVKIKAVPTIKSVEAADIGANRTTFKFKFDDWSSFYDIDEDQFDDDYKAKFKSGTLSLRLDTEDQDIDIDIEDDWGNIYTYTYELEIDDVKDKREVKVSSVQVVSNDTEKQRCVVRVGFEGATGMDLDDDGLGDYFPQKISSGIYEMTVPYGKKTLNFTFVDEDDKEFSCSYDFNITDNTPVGTIASNNGNSSSAVNQDGSVNSPQTGGYISTLAFLINSVDGAA